MKYDWKYKLKNVEDYKQGKWTEKRKWANFSVESFHMEIRF